MSWNHYRNTTMVCGGEILSRLKHVIISSAKWYFSSTPLYWDHPGYTKPSQTPGCTQQSTYHREQPTHHCGTDPSSQRDKKCSGREKKKIALPSSYCPKASHMLPFITLTPISEILRLKKWIINSGVRSDEVGHIRVIYASVFSLHNKILGSVTELEWRHQVSLW